MGMTLARIGLGRRRLRRRVLAAMGENAP